MKIGGIIILSILLFSCNKGLENMHQLPVEIETSETSFHLPIENNVHGNYLKHQVISDSIFIGINPFNDLNSISIFDLKNQKTLKKIYLDRNLFKYNLESFFAVAMDSIYLISYATKDIYLVNSEGQKLNHWNVDNMNGKSYPGPNGYFFSFSLYKNFIVDPHKNKLIASISDNVFHEEPGSSNLPKIIIIDLEKNSIEDFIATPEGKMKSRGDLFFPDDIASAQFEKIGDSLYVSYPFDDLITIYSLRTNQMVSKKNPSAPIELPLFEPVALEKKDENTFMWKYRSSMPFYEDLNYHQESRIFSRIYHYEQDIAANPTYRKSAILFFDSELNYLAHKVIENGEIGVFKSSKTNRGILTGKPENLQENENSLQHNRIFNFNVKEVAKYD